MGTDVGKVRHPDPVRLFHLKLPFQDVRRDMAYLASLEAWMALVAALGANARRLHDPMHPVLSAGLAGVLHVPGDVAITIRKTTFDPELLDLAKQPPVFYRPSALRLSEPGIKTAAFDLQYSTHGRYRIFVEP